MIEELPDDIENDIVDIEPVGEEADAQLYEHFRVVEDKGQAMMRVDKYLFERIVNASRNRIQKAADGTFFAAFEPQYNALPLTVHHFKDRFADLKWIIYDMKRRYGFYYDLQEVTTI